MTPIEDIRAALCLIEPALAYRTDEWVAPWNLISAAIDELEQLRKYVDRAQDNHCHPDNECWQECSQDNADHLKDRRELESLRREREDGGERAVYAAYAEREEIIAIIQNHGEANFGCWNPDLITAIRARGEK